MSCMQPPSGIFREKESNRLNNATTFQKPGRVTCPAFVFLRIPQYISWIILPELRILPVPFAKKGSFLFFCTTLQYYNNKFLSRLMLRKIRLTVAIIFFLALLLLFLDFTGSIHAWMGWTAKIQFMPAVMALNVTVVAILLVLTLIFGRIYCSVICPMGIFQDIAAWFGKRAKKNRYSYSPALSWLRYTVLGIFVIALIAGIGSLAALLEPYSAFGRIASNLFAPVYAGINNLLAYIAERAESYAFYSTDIWIKSMPVFAIAVATFIIVALLAWKNGRTYCNTICPVGTVLGFFARFSWFKPVIDSSKCVNCKACEKNCKASAINIAGHIIDYSRCVACMDCIDKCNINAISYVHPHKTADKPAENEQSVNKNRRSFLTASALVAATAALRAQEKKVDGGLAIIEDKKIPERSTPIVPPGALSLKNFTQHCTACQLCVSVCPNGVLRPSAGLMTLMQPEMSYERGYCRPECVKCSEVCPSGAIKPITVAEKSSIQIGHAVWIRENCIPLTDGRNCGNCARHCPTGAIAMVPSVPSDSNSIKIPVVNVEKCIGCGTCENLCPARPLSAIYVEGHEVHRTI